MLNLIRREPALSAAVLNLAVLALVIYAKLPRELELSLGTIIALLTGVGTRRAVTPNVKL